MVVSAPNPVSLSFSGHETFVLRSNWLKKAYDLLQYKTDLFLQEDAFVRLGVGKNMAQSIRFWGRACHVFEPLANNKGHQATWLGKALFDDTHGWDPFLVMPTSRWLLHWQIAARPEAAYTWYYTFNLLRRGEFTLEQLAQQIAQAVTQRGGRVPSPTTLQRDINCMVRCYQRPDVSDLGAAVEDLLQCPLYELDLIQLLPDKSAYQLMSGAHPDLPDQLVALAALQQARMLGRATVAFNDLAYGERSPGRLFRLDEDALLSRMLRLEHATEGQAVYSETGGIRQIAWRDLANETIDQELLHHAFDQERRYA